MYRYYIIMFIFSTKTNQFLFPFSSLYPLHSIRSMKTSFFLIPVLHFLIFCRFNVDEIICTKKDFHKKHFSQKSLSLSFHLFNLLYKWSKNFHAQFFQRSQHQHPDDRSFSHFNRHPAGYRQYERYDNTQRI